MIILPGLFSYRSRGIYPVGLYAREQSPRPNITGPAPEKTDPL